MLFANGTGKEVNAARIVDFISIAQRIDSVGYYLLFLLMISFFRSSPTGTYSQSVFLLSGRHARSFVRSRVRSRA